MSKTKGSFGHNPCKTDRYKTAQGRAKQLNTPQSIYARVAVSTVFCFAFVIIDTSRLFSVWSAVQRPEYGFVTILLALACGICLDIPLGIAGQVVKGLYQGCYPRKQALIILFVSLATFIATFIPAAFFSITTKELLFESNATNEVIVMASSAVTAATSKAAPSVWVAAIYTAIIPFCTSLASFVICFFSTDMLGFMCYKLQRQLIQIESELIDVNKGLVESSNLKQYFSLKLSRINDALNNSIHEACALGATLKQYARILLIEAMGGSPDDINALAESGAAVNDRTANEAVSLPRSETYSKLMKMLSDNYKLITGIDTDIENDSKIYFYPTKTEVTQT